MTNDPKRAQDIEREFTKSFLGCYDFPNAEELIATNVHSLRVRAARVQREENEDDLTIRLANLQISLRIRKATDPITGACYIWQWLEGSGKEETFNAALTAALSYIISQYLQKGN